MADDTYTRKPSVSIPYLTGGTYYFLIDVNSDRSEFEDSSNNILASSAQTLPNASLPNLIVDSIYVPPSVFSGKAFTVEWRVKNIGSAATTGSWSDRIYLAADTSYLNNKSPHIKDSLQVLEKQAPRGLAVGESYTSSYTFSTPIKFSGNLYYRAQANGNLAIFEQDTSHANNGKNSTSLNVVQSPLPDLTVTDLNVPLSAFSGDTVSVNWTVKNVGQQKTYRTDRFYRATPLADNPIMWSDRLVITKDRFYDPDSKENIPKAYYTRPSNDELEVDSSYRVDRDISFDRCEYGTYYVFVETNYRYTTFELLFGNNAQLVDSIELILQPNPDLKPTALSLGNSPASGNDLAINYTVLNDGFDDIEGVYHTNRFFLHPNPQIALDELIGLGKQGGPDTLLNTDSYSSTANLQIPYDVYGDMYLSIITDYNDNVCEEPLEDNNVLTTSQINIALSPQPDIVIDIDDFPDTLYAGQNFTLIVETKNQGPGDADESFFRNELFVSGPSISSLKRYIVPVGLGAGNSRFDTLLVSIPISVKEGTYQYNVIADYSGNVYEHNAELNNSYWSGPFTILRDNNSVSDLEVVDLKVIESDHYCWRFNNRRDNH